MAEQKYPVGGAESGDEEEDEQADDDWILNAVHHMPVDLSEPATEVTEVSVPKVTMITASGDSVAVGSYVSVPETDRSANCQLGFKLGAAVQFALDNMNLGALEVNARSVERKVMAKEM